MGSDRPFRIALARTGIHLKRPAVHGARDSAPFELPGPKGSATVGTKVVDGKEFPPTKEKCKLPAVCMNSATLAGLQAADVGN